MKLTFRLLMATTIASVIAQNSKAQTSNLESVLQQYTYDKAPEKLYLHLDRPYYAAGDDLWFKAYLTFGPKHVLSPLSQTLYVELFDPNNDLLIHSMFPIENGLAKGDLSLPDSLSSGEYTIRAYTNWMQNYDEAFFFKRKIKVFNPTAYTPPNLANAEPKLQFFPEGGNLITGFTSKLGYKYTDAFGKGSSIQGKIIDDQGALVSVFQTNSEGYGVIAFQPQSGLTYDAVLADSKIITLPESKIEGLVLTTDNLSDPEFLSLKLASSKYSSALVVIHARGEISFASQVNFPSGKAQFKIPKSDLGLGLNHITIFNNDWKPLAERLIFNPVKSGLNSKITSAQSVYSPRDSMTLELKVTDDQGKPVQGFFSMSVTDDNQVSLNPGDENISAYLQMNSDLINPILQPDGLGGNPRSLDLKLLTRTWRRFHWNDVMSNNSSFSYAVEQGLTVKGTVLKDNGKPLKNAMVKFIGEFEGFPSLAETKADINGRFEFKGLFYDANGDNFLKGQNKKGNAFYDLEVVDEKRIPDFYPTPNSLLLDPKIESEFQIKAQESLDIQKTLKSSAKLSETELADLIKSMESGENVTDLGEVEVSATKKRDPMRPLLGRGEYQIGPELIERMSHYVQNPLYFLSGRLPGVLVFNDGPLTRVTLSRVNYSFINQTPAPQFYLDEQLTDISIIQSLPRQKIRSIEVYKGMRAQIFFGEAAAGGAIVYYTKNPEELAESVVRTMKFKELFNGYQNSREFAGPNYFKEAPEALPDLRALIHWEPMIETDENGYARVTFYNADAETKISVRLEGITQGGQTIVGGYNYQVKRN